ncbi:1092_t:CDS:10, partial [Cetraspora pellucida]
SNVLAKFPLNVRKVLISEITQTLLQTHDPNLLSSITHVKWVMEAVGQGFALPLEEMSIITANSKELYSQWLFEPNSRPAAIRNATGQQEEQEFWQIIFHHYSLLFQPRYQTPASNISTPTTPGFPASSSQITTNCTHLQNHIELCKGVLIVLTMAGRTLGPQFSEETWLVLLKVVLGITDCLLHEPISTTTSDGNMDKKTAMTMADELCEHLLRVLFELWLRSKIRKVEMWDIFKKCFNQWTHRHQALLQWNATTLALTQRVVRLLYGPKEGADMVNVSVGGYNVGLDLPTDFVYYAWHRMVYLINNPCTLPSSNFSSAISGIGKVIEAFQIIGQPTIHKSSQQDLQQDSFFAIPDGNTILRMFGPWLFQACMMSRPDAGTQLGRAAAFGILCRIFCLPQKREKFLHNYVTQFYFALIEGLRVDSCLPTILISTTSLFATELEGVRMMVPDFVVGIKMILPKLAPGFKIDVPLEDLRLAAIRVASTIMCLPNHFEKVPMRENWSIGLHQNGDRLVSNDDEIMVNELMRVLYSEDESDISKKENKPEPFTALKFYILELLLKSLKTEKSTYNLRYLLHLINVYVVEDVAFCPGLVSLVVKSIQEKVLTMNLPSDVTLYAFDVLKDFVGLYEYVQRDSKNCARELVLEFCRYIDTMLSGAYGGLSITFHLVEKAYDCMMRWILVGQWIVGDRDCHEAVISTISKGISIVPNNDDDNAQQNSPADKKKNRKDPIPNKLFAPRAKMSTANNESILQAGGQNRCGKKGEMAVKLAAEIAMSQFVNHLGNFPAWSDHIGPSRVSTLFNDDLLLAKARIAESNVGSIPELVRYFLVDGRVVIGFVEIPKHPVWIINKDPKTLTASDNFETPVEAGTPVSSPGTPKAPIPQEYIQKELDETDDCPSVIIVMRDSTGKYSWESHMCYKPPIGDGSKIRPLSPEIDKELHEPTLLSPLQSIPVLRTETPPHFLYESHGTKDQSFIKRIACFNNDQIPTVDNIFEAGCNSWRAYREVKKLTQRQKEIEKQAFEERRNAKFDHKRRNCLSVSVYYIQSGSDDLEHIINPPSISKDFERFLNSLGWPVSLDTHSGYKAKLDSSICKTAPYFADRSVEVIFNVPYLIKAHNNDLSSDSLSNLFKNIFSDDIVCIVWVDDVLSMQSAPSKIGQSALVYIFVHPLQNATGLYWIRIITPTAPHSSYTSIGSGPNSEKRTGKGKVNWNSDASKLNEIHLTFGPLVDGMIVSRHTIGSLVRNTAISAHDACRNFTETRIRQPYAVRRQFIDEMYNKYKTSLSISE